MPTARSCSRPVRSSDAVDYAFDISADEWAKIDDEFRNRDALEAAGVDYKTFHPIVLHYGGETVSDARSGSKASSWATPCATTATRRGCSSSSRSRRSTPPRSSTASASSSSTCRITTRRSFRTARLRTMAEFRAAAPCANSARVTINGAYYGLYVSEEHVGGGYIKRVFPEAPDGDLFAGGRTPKTNELMPDKAKLVVVLGGARHRLHGGGGRHGRVDRGVGRRGAAERRRRLLGRRAQLLHLRLRREGLPVADGRRGRDLRVARAQRCQPDLLVGRANIAAGGGPALPDRDGGSDLARNYLAAVRAQLARWDVATPAGMDRPWSAQIADAVAQDPHRLHSLED